MSWILVGMTVVMVSMFATACADHVGLVIEHADFWGIGILSGALAGMLVMVGMED